MKDFLKECAEGILYCWFLIFAVFAGTFFVVIMIIIASAPFWGLIYLIEKLVGK